MGKEDVCIECGKKGTIARSLCNRCYQRARTSERLGSAPEYTCVTCGKPFKSLTKNATHCSRTCVINDPAVMEKSIAVRTKDTKTIPCANCGKMIRRNKTQMKKSVNKVCSKECEIALRKKASAVKKEQRSKTPCSNDGCDNIGVVHRGLCKSCYNKWLMMKPENRHKHKGVCPVCGKAFLSWYKSSKYCSRDCYIKSEPFKKARVRYIEECRAARTKKACLNCGKQIELRPSENSEKRFVRVKESGESYYTGSKKFCSRACYREYFASRFDRYIAQGACLNKPVGYDQFLSQETLPCLVDGCDWVGDNLSMHMNVAHGICADELKALAGFNRTTGVISTGLSKRMSERSKTLKLGNKDFGDVSDKGSHIGHPMRPEGIEHTKRSRAMR